VNNIIGVRNTRFFPILVLIVATGFFIFLSIIFLHFIMAQTMTSWGDNFVTPYTMITDGSVSPNLKWRDVYGGYGLKGVTNGYFFEYPKTSTSPGETHATLTTSTASFRDFQMTMYMKTVKQLRQNSLPNPWETAWIFWHYTDQFHNYALVLKTNGFQIEKKDNNVRCDCEIFLKTTSTPTVQIGQWQRLTLRVTNSAFNTPHIQVWVNGVVAADFIDNSIGLPNAPQLQTGYMGMYDEDSITNFADVYVTPLS
jgi:3-keto-disaccharide hydrolase